MEQTRRDSFRSRWGFKLACIGSAVGMGNIWLFPSRMSAYGGATFLIPYVIFVVLIASTGMESVCAALQQLHCPRVLTTTILLIYRYIVLLLQEGIRIATAYALRAPGQKGIQFRAWGSLLGQLLLHSIDRAQLVYESMQLRGFAGAFPPGQKKHGGWLFFAVTVFYCAVFRAVPVFELAGRLL